MSVVHLLGEDHSNPGRDLWALGMLLKIEKEYPPLLGISFELDRQAYQAAFDKYTTPGQDSALGMIMEFARRRSIACLATDDRDSSDALNELSLERRIGSEPNPDLVESYRILTRANMKHRNEQTAQYLAEFLHDKQGSVAHRCGLLHMAGLARRLGKRGITTLCYDTRRSLEAEKPRVFSSKTDDILLSTQHVFVCLDYDGKPLDSASLRIAQRWPDGYARARSHLSPEGIPAINYTNTPPITVLEIRALAPLNEQTALLAQRLQALGDNDYVESFALPWLPCFNEAQFQDLFARSFSHVVVYPSQELATPQTPI